MERRRMARRSPAAEEPLARARLRTGREVAVVDVSNCGALVEGARLLPGTHVDIHVVTPEGRLLVRSRVARCYVHAVRAELVLYRGALAFDRLVDTRACGYAIPGDERQPPFVPAPAYPAPAGAPVVALDKRLSA